jgi:proteic killer suppression protein
MIKSYGDRDIRLLYDKYKCPKWFPTELLEKAYAKLFMLDAAQTENDLRVPLSNHYEHLKGDMMGRSSIRINLKWRLTFVWKGGNAYEAKIEDYH